MSNIKNVNKEKFNYLYKYYLNRELNNKQIAKKLNISIRSLYYYKKDIVSSKKSKITRILYIKEKNIIIYKKRIKTIKIKRIKKQGKIIGGEGWKKTEKALEVRYTFEAICQFDSPPFRTTHYFTWIGKPGIPEKTLIAIGKLQHKFWKFHKLIELTVFSKDYVYGEL